MSRRVLYLLRYYPTLTETFVYRELAGLLERGWRPEVGSLEARADGALQDALPPLPVRRPPRDPLHLRQLRGLGRLLARPEGRAAWRFLAATRPPRRVLPALWLARQVRDFPRVHVHFAGEAAEWARAGWLLHGVPYSVTVHAVDLFKPRPSLDAVLRDARVVLTVSRHNQRLLERRGVRARLLRCGVPVPPGEPPPRAPHHGPLRVLAVGRWVEKKGFDELVAAVEALRRPVRLRLVSDAPASLASERVEVLGLQPPSRLPGLLAWADLLALPARRARDGDMDGVPVVLMEALAAGVPVLATALSGIPELVDEEVGWLLPPGDRGALLRALEEAAAEPGERLRRGRRGPARLRERGFTLEAQLDGLLRAWEEG